MANQIEISPRELRRLICSAAPLQLVDIRGPAAFGARRITGARLIPMTAIPTEMPALRARTPAGPLVLYCEDGFRSFRAAKWVRLHGIVNCFSLAGGIQAWRREVEPSLDPD